MQDILINWSPQETRVAIVENGAVQELHVERTLERGLVGNVYPGKVARVLPGMQSAFIDIGLERAAFLHVADVHGSGSAARRATAPSATRRRSADREAGVRGPDADGAGDQGPDRHQGRAAVDADQHRRPAAGLPAAGRPHRHLAEDRLARAARAAARAHEGAGRQPERTASGGFILRTNAEDATDAELADDIAYLRKTWAAIRERALQVAAGIAAAPGPEPGRSACCATWPTSDTQIDPHRLAAAVRHAARLRRGVHAERRSASCEHYKGERPIFDLYNDRRGDRAGARRGAST